MLSLEFPSMHMEFTMLRHGYRRASTARKIMCSSSNMGVHPGHPPNYRYVNAMFTRLEPPLARGLHECSPDLHRRSQPCNRGAHASIT
jgi:hypothetical protein